MITALDHPPSPPAIIEVYQSGQAQDISWKSQFSGAVSWSTYGVTDDSGITDNTAALNSIPANTTVIADCPNGGYVSFSGTWAWPAGLKVWQQPGCWLKSTITTPGTYPITGTGGATATSSTPNVSYYGLQFAFVTQTNAVRVLQGWFDHLKIKYFHIDNSGGFAWIRGSDREIAYGYTTNTYQASGNPGIRDIGTLPEVPMSPGMKAHNWFHNLNFDSGDASFQACQPGGTTSNTWYYQASTDSSDGLPALLYENDYSSSLVGFVILVNLPVVKGGFNYVCRNVTFNHVSGIGTQYATIGNSPAETSHIRIYNSDYYGGIGSGANRASISVGKYPVGGSIATSANVSDVIIDGLTMNGEYGPAIAAINSRDTHFRNITIGKPLIGTGSVEASIWTDGSVGTEFTNITLDMGNQLYGFADGMATNAFGQVSGPSISASTHTQINNMTITGTTNTKSGMAFVHSDGAVVSGGSVSSALGATTAAGLTLSADPNGTHYATINGVNLSGAAVPITCAPGQQNYVVNNPGASDCPAE